MFNVSVSSNLCNCKLQRQIFVTARDFVIIHFDNILQKYFTAVIAIASRYQRELSNFLPIGHLPAQRQQQKH